MKYILREIESEEDFIEVFGQKPGWVLSTVRLSKLKQKSEDTQNTYEKVEGEE